MDPNKIRIIRKFNPGVLQSDEEIIEQFVVRKHQLKTILTLLQDNIESPSCQHALIIAPRGRGKTMLLTRAAAELRSKKEFSRYLLPVRFIEESQEILTMADFWLETLYHLAIECKRVNQSLAEELHKRHATLIKKWSNDTLEEHAKIAVLDAADRIERKLVLMVENFQSLNEAVDKDFGWELRHILQSEPQIILLGSATSRFTGIDDATQPFFELFRIIKLQPLNTNECLRFWNFLTGDDSSIREIRPLEILTGGSPRLIVIFASFTRHKSIRQLMEELVLMIDELTDYFRGNLGSLANSERRVFIAVIDLWSPSTPSEISVRARMDIRTVSTMLGRLVKKEIVKMDGNGRKRKYSAYEPLYSFYFKLRRNRDDASIVQALIRFMSAFYTDAEQEEIFHKLTVDMDGFPAIANGFLRALKENPRIIKYLHREYLERVWSNVVSIHQRTLGTEVMEAFKNRAFPQVIHIIDRAISSQYPKINELPRAFILWLLQIKAVAQQKIGDLSSALSTAEEIIEGYSDIEDVELQPLIAISLIIKGEVLQAQLNLKLTHSTTNEDIEYLNPLEIDSVSRTLNVDGELSGTQYYLKSAVEAFEVAVERLGSIEKQEFQWYIAKALTNKGNILHASGQLERALITFKDIVERFRDTENLELVLFIKHALFYLGEISYRQGHLERALSFLEEVDHDLSTNKNPELEIWGIWALMIKGKILRSKNELGPALLVYEDMLERCSSKVNPVMQLCVAHALINKGKIFKSQNKLDTALSIFEEIIERFNTSNIPELQFMVSNALVHKTLTLSQFDGTIDTTLLLAVEKTINFVGDLDLSRSTNEMPLPLQNNLALMLMIKGSVLSRLNKIEKAAEAYDESIDRLSSSENLELQNLSVWPLICKVELQANEGKIEDASNTYNELIRRLDERNLDKQYRLKWEVLRLGTQILLDQGDFPAATDSFRSLYTVFKYDSKKYIRVISNLVIRLVAGGVSSSSLLEILSINDAQEDILYPLFTALRLEAGEEVHVPEEILEIASDIREDFQGVCQN